MVGRVKQRGASGCCRLAFARAAQGLERALQPQKLGCLLLPGFAAERRSTPQRRQLPLRLGVSNAGTPGVPTVTLNFGYDQVNNRTSMSDSLGGSMSYTYDAEHNLTSESFALNGSTGAVISFAHDSLQRSNDETRSDGTGHLYDIDSTLDSTGRLTNLQYYDMTASATVANYTYGYDAGDEVTSYQDANSSLTYTYDHTGQLLSATGTLNGSNYSASWSYDANGNRNMTGYQTGTGNELLNDGTFTYTYDKNGNTATQKNLQTGSVTYYTWDYDNRLTEVKVENSLGTVLNDEKFTYDVFGNQIGESLNGTQQRWTVFDGSNPYIDFNGSGTVTERYLTNPNSLDQFFGQVSGSGTTEWFVTDNLGSVRQAIDSSGNQLDAITYDPYGSIITQTSTTYAPRFLYTGAAYDPIMGTYLDGAREDNPEDGRWLSQDPSGLGPDSNPYRYVGNAPVDAIDPTGLFAWEFNEATQTVTMVVAIRLVWKDSSSSSWTDARKGAFEQKFMRVIQDAWNSNNFRIYPARAELVRYGKPYCTLGGKTKYPIISIRTFPGGNSGWKPAIQVVLRDSGYDFKVQVESNPTGQYIKSTTIAGGTWWGTDAWLDEDDVNMQNKPNGQRQIPAVHEFGHLLGLKHPGAAGAPDEYSADAPSLMGDGMDLRTSYFSRWVEAMDDKYWRFAPFSIR